MNHQPLIRFELDPKITEEEIAEATYDNEKHVGTSAHFNKLLNLLVNLKAFGNNVKASSVPHLIYEESSHLEPTPTQEKSGKKDTHWGDRRFARLRYGKSSFINREAQYFYDAFQQVFGREWSRLVTRDELILNPLAQTFRTIQDTLLPGIWSELDPIQILRILELGQSAPDLCPKLSIQYADATRISKQREQAPELSEIDSEKCIMPVGTSYYLYVEQPTDTNVLVFEYAETPLLSDELDEPVQAQQLNYVDESQAIQLIGGDNSKPLEIMNHRGNFGYCAISYPADWDIKEAFDLPDKEWLTVSELQRLVKKIRVSMVNENKVQFSLLDYVVLHGNSTRSK